MYTIFRKDATGFSPSRQSTAVPEIEADEQVQEKPEGGPGPDDPFRGDRYACRSRTKSAALPTATVRFSSGTRRFPPG
ncbi:MAG TPA: hypothetical protein PK814_01265, partial [Syntrophales bacterium]|nr:hypothetical protein [Syntrophales bacterium]